MATLLPMHSASDDYRRSIEWDVSSGPSNYLFLVVSQAASAVFAFTAVWIATSALGPGGYGVIVAIIAASQFIGQMTTQWTAVSLSRYGCEEFVKTGRVTSAFWARLLILLPSVFVVSAGARLWLPPVATWLHVPPEAHVLILLHFAVTAVWIHVQQAIQAVKLPKLQAVLLVLERAQIVLIVFMLALEGQATVMSVALVYITAPLLTSVLGLWRLRRFVYPGIRLDRAFSKQMLVFSLPLLPFSLLGFFSTNYLDAFFIVRFLSVADLGVYSVSSQLAGNFMQLPVLAGSLLLPFFITLYVNRRDEDVTRFLCEIVPVLSLLWSSCCACVAAAGGYLLPVLFGPRFSVSISVLWVLFGASALAGPVLIGYTAISRAKSATHMSALTSLVSAVVNVPLNFLLIPRFGLVGCAWATVAAYGASAVVWEYLIRRIVPLRGGWSLQATIPGILGAVYVSWKPDILGALTLSILAAAVIGLAHRRAVVTSIQTLGAMGMRSRVQFFGPKAYNP